MEFTIDRDTFLKSLARANGIIEKKTTLPILSNILMEAANSKLTITATDLDLIFIHQLSNVEILEEGKWGQLFKVGDVNDLSVKILSALDNNIEYDTKSRARYFSSSRCVEQYEKLFVES